MTGGRAHPLMEPERLRPLTGGVPELSCEDAAQATAAELMFFRGAPLAHVVAYCEHQRRVQIDRRKQELSRRAVRRLPGAGRSVFGR